MDHIYRYAITPNLGGIVTDQETWIDYFKEYPIPGVEIKLYPDTDYTMDKLYGIDTELDRATQERVYLPSGGYLLIEPTETMTVIDVNSGKNVKKKKQADYAYENNVEAAREAARQLRLRNISGMILVDFINMNSKEQEEQLLTLMRELTRSDYVNVTVLDITRLGLMEITRAKKYASLREQLSK